MNETGRVEHHRVLELKQQVVALPDDMTLSQWFDILRSLQEIAYGKYYDRLSDEDRADTMMMNLFAMVCEVVEMGQEMGWKPWASPRGWIHPGPVISEGVDQMHFLGNLFTHAGASGAAVGQELKRKIIRNLERQLEGYDGQSTKCPECKRALDDGIHRYVDHKGREFCSELCAAYYKEEEHDSGE